MAQQPAENGLELDVNMRLQRVIWKVQRLAWVVAFLVLVMIALGITGDGPLADARRASDDDGLAIEYARFARETAPTTMRLAVTPGPDASEVQLWLGQVLLDQYRIEQITPEPDSTTLDSERLLLSFPVASSGGEMEIDLELEPRTRGAVASELGLVDGPDFEITQIVYP